MMARADESRVSNKVVFMPLPEYGFGPTESAVPWRALTRAGHRVVFATADGERANADTRMVTGRDLPVLFRETLMARPHDVRAHREVEAAEAVRDTAG